MVMQKEIKKQADRRLKIIAGQVQGLQRMVEAEKYCVDIITQAQAVKRSLDSFEALILKNHLETHVKDQITSGRMDQATEEILRIYNLANKQK